MKIVVVGGGTAGWLTALYVQKTFSDSQVSMIASSEIGILGAGEGSTVDFVRFLNDLDIPKADIIQHARGTIKSGIKFTNWNGDGQSYFHPFLDKQYIDDVDMYCDEIFEGNNLDEVQYTSLSALRKKVLYKVDGLEKVCNDSLHFDATLLAKHLESVGVARGIKLYDQQVTGFKQDSDGNITSIVTDSNIIPADFVFDCSGFKRLIIGKLYNSPWHSYAGTLPVNRAMPFFIPNEGEELPPYTEAIAMKYGWMWKIPVQGRYGCGYAFDSSFATDEEIKQEIEEYVGHEITSPKIFSFSAGCFEKVWIKNCIAVGLSTGFTEPLEATSIWVSIQILEMIKLKLDGIYKRDTKAIDEFNQTIRNMNEEIVNFIHFHYLTHRSDSEFWKTFREKNTAPELVRNFAEISDNTLPTQRDIDYITQIMETRTAPNYIQTFEIVNWYTIGAGIKFFKPNFRRPKVNKAQYKSVLLTKSNELINHMTYIEKLKNAS